MNKEKGKVTIFGIEIQDVFRNSGDTLMCDINQFDAINICTYTTPDPIGETLCATECRAA